MKTEQHATFKVFEEIIMIVVNTDQMSVLDTNEWINDLYICYKDTKYFDVIEFAKFWFASLNKDTHNIWLDRRGLMLYELKGMLMQTASFPIF